MRPVFIGGCDRSGTTLLGAMLGAHRDCVCVPEAQFIIDLIGYKVLSGVHKFDLPGALQAIIEHPRFKLWAIDSDKTEAIDDEIGSFAQLVEWVVRQYGRVHGKPEPEVWVDHTPWNTRYGASLFDLYPQSKLIHIVRDGRAVAASILPLTWGPKTIDQAAYFWLRNLSFGLAAEIYDADRVIRVRYEDLVSEPKATLKELCAFVDLDYQERMVLADGFQVPSFTQRQHALIGQRPDSSRINAWQNDLSARQIEIFESITGDALAYFGYQLQFGANKRTMTTLEKITSSLSIPRMYVGNFSQGIRMHLSAQWRSSKRTGKESK